MSYVQQYTELGTGVWHALAEDTNYTVCGLDVPYGNPYQPLTSDMKQPPHCGPDAEEPKPKGKKAKDASTA